MIQSNWRQQADAVIRRVISEYPNLPDNQLRKKVSAAYPFGERAMHPYKIWLSAVERHLGPSEQALRARRKRNDELKKLAGQRGFVLK